MPANIVGAQKKNKHKNCFNVPVQKYAYLILITATAIREARKCTYKNTFWESKIS